MGEHPNNLQELNNTLQIHIFRQSLHLVKYEVENIKDFPFKLFEEHAEKITMIIPKR